MPKRASAEDDSPSVKKTRIVEPTTPRRSSLDASSDFSSAQAQPFRTPSTVSPAMLSEASISPESASIRRRMNPDSLAGRLGSELVKELEALLQPGMTEMPPFAVRQVIQQRFNVDRRHIYDWYHNKGLRVSSSEKREEKRAVKLSLLRRPDTRTQASMILAYSSFRNR